MYIRVIDAAQPFAGLRRQWNDLLDRSSHPGIFLTHEWLFSWWETFGGHNRLYVLLCYEHTHELAGILPAYIKTKGIVPRVRALRFLGSEEVTSDFLTCIAAQGREREVYDAVLDYLLGRKELWNVLEFTGMESGKPFAEYLEARCGPTASAVFRAAHVKCPYIALPGSWEEFLGSLSFKARKKTRYYRNALAKKGEVGLFTLRNEHELDGALDDVARLHGDTMERKGWKEKFSSGKYRDFYKKTCERLLSLGRLELNFLLVDGTRVAFLNSFKYRNRFYAYHTGFDMTWRDYSVGFVLLGLLIERAISEGCTHFEFLRGDQKYKYEWAVSGERSLTDFVLHGNSPAGRLYGLKCSVMRRSRGMLGNIVPSAVRDFARRVFRG